MYQTTRWSRLFFFFYLCKPLYCAYFSIWCLRSLMRFRSTLVAACFPTHALSWPLYPPSPPSDNVSCHRVLIYLRALFMDTFTSTDHRAHTAVLQTTVASPRITARLRQQCSPPTSLHGKGHAGLMTCYLKRTWWILKAGQAQSNYTPGRHGAFAELRLSDILFLFRHLYYVRLCLDSGDVLRFKLLLLHPGLSNR